jgi:hypothetical protein
MKTLTSILAITLASCAPKESTIVSTAIKTTTVPAQIEVVQEPEPSYPNYPSKSVDPLELSDKLFVLTNNQENTKGQSGQYVNTQGETLDGTLYSFDECRQNLSYNNFMTLHRLRVVDFNSDGPTSGDEIQVAYSFGQRGLSFSTSFLTIFKYGEGECSGSVQQKPVSVSKCWDTMNPTDSSYDDPALCKTIQFPQTHTYCDRANRVLSVAVDNCFNKPTGQ